VSTHNTSDPTAPRVALIDGRRTPFLRSQTEFIDLSTYDLGCAAVAGLLHATRIDPEVVDLLVMGRVLSDPKTPNLAREVVFGTDLPDACAAHTVSLACVSSLQSTLDVARAIQTGAASVGIAAGAEVLSDAPIRVSRPIRKRLIASQKARGVGDWLGLLSGLRARHLAPEIPAIAEPSTGETMGENGERLAKRLGITREAQDELALASHHAAGRAMDAGLLQRQITPVFPPPRCEAVRTDNGVRPDTTLEKLARLSPSFDRRAGTISAGNASFLTDGAAAVLLMSEERASELGCEPLAFLKASAVVGLEPYEELLLGPALSAPRALAAAGIELADVGTLEIHEAFAAPVLAALQLFEDEAFCHERLGRDAPVGTVDRDRLNAWGGSLSVGHPFGATGARLVTTCLHRMQHEDSRYGLVTGCASGAIGIALVLERPA
jgi:acetyl-CoA acyltransferase